jgi:hypothetical protein
VVGFRSSSSTHSHYYYTFILTTPTSFKCKLLLPHIKTRVLSSKAHLYLNNLTNSNISTERNTVLLNFLSFSSINSSSSSNNNQSSINHRLYNNNNNNQ